MKNARFAIIVLIGLLFFAALNVSGVGHAQPQGATPDSSTKAPDTAVKEASPWTTFWFPALRVFSAFAIGLVGSSAYFAGVYLGFIERRSRPMILKFLLFPKGTTNLPRIAWFVAFGGLIAAVFQWAQLDALAPIQALVLGASWPSALTRAMSGGQLLEKDVTDVDPSDVPVPAGRRPEDTASAEVVVS